MLRILDTIKTIKRKKTDSRGLPIVQFVIISNANLVQPVDTIRFNFLGSLLQVSFLNFKVTIDCGLKLYECCHFLSVTSEPDYRHVCVNIIKVEAEYCKPQMNEHIHTYID
jgi:hypothetical protein